MGERLKLSSVSGNVVSFDTDLEKNLGSLKIGIEPVQEGSGDPSPDNIRVISGYTSINIIQQKKNFFDADTQYEIYKQSDGSYLGQGIKFDAIRMYIPSFLINQQITFSALIRKPENSTITNPRVCAVVNGSTLNGDFINTSDYSLSSITFIPKSTDDYIRITYGSSGSGTIQLKNVQLEIGSTTTDYEPYVSTTYPITLPSAAGTVYGGELDLVKGELTVNKAMIDLGSLVWTYKTTDTAATYPYFLSPRLTNRKIGNNMICSHYKVSSGGRNTLTDKSVAAYNLSNEYSICIADSSYTSASDFKDAMEGVQLIYELRTPIIYAITPTEISTLLGANTLYADCGPIQEASYFSRDYVPVASDTGLITITDGVEAPIDSLKIHFEPVQEGSGDPSPENVRPISGWTGANVMRTGKNLFSYDPAKAITGITTAGAIRAYYPLEVSNCTLSFSAELIDSGNVTTSNINIGMLKDGKLSVLNSLIMPDGITERTFTFSENEQAVLMTASNSVASITINFPKYRICVTIGSTPQSYEPYTGQTYPITFPSEAGTVYGGYVDVAKGELVVNKAKKSVTSFDKIFVPSSEYENLNGNIFVKNFGFPRANVILSNIFTSTNVSYNKMPLYSCKGTWGVANEIYFILPSSIATVEEANEWLINNSTEIIYTLSEPLTYSLTPTQLSTIKGLNNIYSDANGAIEMSYYSPVKENMIATRRSVVASAPHTETTSGGIASFETNMAAKLKNLTVNIEHVQDLHGYDRPWPAGGGKNKFNSDSTDKKWVSISGSISEREDTKSITISVSEGQTVCLSNANNSSATNILLLVFYDSADNVLLRKPESNGAKYVSAVAPEGTAYLIASFFTWQEASDAQLEFGVSTPTSYAPYSNICPISGWTGANVTRNGVNQWDEEWEVGTIDFNTGEIANANNRIRTKNFNTCSPNTTYYGIDPTSNNNIEIFFYDKNKVYIRNSGWTGNATFISPKNACYFKFIMGAAYGTTYNNDISINYPSTDVNYHSYVGTTTPITFPTEAGTVYGGTLDVTTGELTVDRVIVDLGTLAWGTFVSSTGTVFSASLPNSITDSPNARRCSVYKSDVNVVASQAGAIANCTIARRSNNSTVFVKDDRFTYDSSGASALKSALAGQIYIYEAAPQIYQITPTEIQTLLGANNIYADTGNTNLTYWKH